MTKKNNWPEFVPVLTSKDICKYAFTSDDGKRHCLSGWLSDVFGFFGSEKSTAALTVNKILEKMNVPDSTIVGFNDHTKTTKTQIAEVWNEAMKKLGYTEVVDA